MTNFELIIAAVLLLIFLSGCATERVVVDKEVEEMQAFFDKCNTLPDFFGAMMAEGFHYANEINDMNFYVDKPPAPEKTYARKWANCVGFASFVAAFIKYKGTAADSYQIISLRQRGVAGIVIKWHEIVVAKVGDQFYETSNLQIRAIDNVEQSKLLWASMGYPESEVIEVWNR